MERRLGRWTGETAFQAALQKRGQLVRANHKEKQWVGGFAIKTGMISRGPGRPRSAGRQIAKLNHNPYLPFPFWNSSGLARRTQRKPQ